MGGRCGGHVHILSRRGGRSQALLTDKIEHAKWSVVDGELIATVSEVVRIYDTEQLGWLSPDENQ